MLRVVVTGADGQLGRSIQKIASSYPGLGFHFLSRADIDVCDAGNVHKVLSSLQPDYLVNCAAYTAVDKAESEPEAAFAVNAEGVKNIAAACNEQNIKLIHISTDYVFSGDGNQPYKEEDGTRPLNIYGASKEKGEQLCLQVNPEAIIIRVSWLFSEFGTNFVKTMMRLMNERDELNIVADQKGTPTYAGDLAEAILKIIHSGKWQRGIYHFSNEGVTNWYRFAEAIREHTASSCALKAITTDQYPTPAKRPSYSVLDHSKIVNVFNLTIRSWRESLEECIAALSSNS